MRFALSIEGDISQNIFETILKSINEEKTMRPGRELIASFKRIGGALSNACAEACKGH